MLKLDDVVLSNVLVCALSHTVPGVPVLLVQILESVVLFKNLMEESTRVRGLNPGMP